MKTYSMSNLSQKEYNEVLAIWKKRRTIYWLLTLLAIPAPFTLSFALFCNNNIVYLTSGGRRTTPGIVAGFHIILGVFLPIIIVPILRFIPGLGHLVLGTKLLD